MRRWLIVVGVIAAAGATGTVVWRQTVSNPVTRVARLAGDADQERLWRAASTAHTRAALEHLADPEFAGSLTPQPRQPQAKPLPQDPDAIPPNVPTTIRIVSRMSPEPTVFTGRAMVVSVDLNGERIGLQFGAKREITVAARVMGKPLGVSKGDLVALQLNWNPGLLERQHIIGVRTNSGIDVATIVVTGPSPIALKTVLLTGEPFILMQVGPPVAGAMSLQVVLPNIEDTIDLSKAQRGAATDRQYGARTIRVLSSAVRPRGSDGAPYGIDIVTWRLK
jgi:hypothetical protein